MKSRSAIFSLHLIQECTKDGGRLVKFDADGNAVYVKGEEEITFLNTKEGFRERYEGQTSAALLGRGGLETKVKKTWNQVIPPQDGQSTRGRGPGHKKASVALCPSWHQDPLGWEWWQECARQRAAANVAANAEAKATRQAEAAKKTQQQREQEKKEQKRRQREAKKEAKNKNKGKNKKT